MKMEGAPKINAESNVAPEKNIEKSSMPVLDDSFIQEKLKLEPEHKNTQFVEVPLNDKEKNFTAKELSEKYNLSLNWAYTVIKKGYRYVDNPDFTSSNKEKLEKAIRARKFLDEVTPIAANSIESLIGNPAEQELIRGFVDNFNTYKYYGKEVVEKKRFKLLNGKELSFGDLVVLNKLAELKLHRDSDGQLMMLVEGVPTPFAPKDFFGQHRSFTYRNNFISEKDSEKSKSTAISLESFAPEVYKAGIFRENDFNRRQSGSIAYEVNGPHERKLTPENPSVFLTNSCGSAKYYLGRQNFTGTDKKINHDTVSVTILDDNSAAVMDTIHGRKVILYTFPLITKEQYEEKKEEVRQRRYAKNLSQEKNINDYITVSVNNLSEYSVTNYFPKNVAESEVDYANRISKLSDTSYVLGNFRSFMSETGLAANNYSWREQLILSDALTSVDQKNKIIKFGRQFGKDGLRTFLSVEHGGREMGDRIVNVGEKLLESGKKGVAEQVFAKYGEVIDTANSAQKILDDLLPDKAITDSGKEIAEIKESLLIRAKDLLVNFYDKKEKDSEELLKNLERYKTEILLYAETYKKLKQSGKEIRLEDIRNTEITILSQEEKEKIANTLWDITKANRPFIKEGTTEMENREEDFYSTIENKNSDFYVLRHGSKDSIVAFCSFTQDENGDFYAESLNVESEIRGSQIGGEFFPTVLEKIKDQGKDIYGHVHPGNAKILPYYERLGFITKEVLENGVLKYYEVRIPVENITKLVA